MMRRCNVSLPFPFRQSADVIHPDPFVTREVWRGHETLPLRELFKSFVGYFDGGGHRKSIGRCDQKHLPADVKAQMILPLYVFGNARVLFTNHLNVLDRHVAALISAQVNKSLIAKISTSC